MVAMICPEKHGDPVTRLYHNQYVTDSGKWATDYDHKATCKTDKVEILEYCKKVSEQKSLRLEYRTQEQKRRLEKPKFK